MMIKLYLIFLLSGVTLASCNQNEGDKQQTIKESENNDSTVMEDVFLNENTNQSNTDTKKLATESAKEKPVLCTCFLLNSVQVQLFDTIQGEVIGTIKNDIIAEVYYSVAIIGQQDKWIKISAEAINKEKTGWIKFKENYFGVYGANYIGTLKIYDQPDIKSKIVNTYEYFIEPMKVLDWNKDWIKIRLNANGVKSKGWVKKGKTCPNPYSTCN